MRESLPGYRFALRFGEALRKAGKPRQRRVWLAALLLFLALAGGAGGWLLYRQRPPAPVPPVVDLEGADPAVVAVIEKARLEILKSPNSASAWGKLGCLLNAFNHRSESLTCLVQAERLDPNQPRWPYYQGILLLLDNPPEAIPKLRRAAELCSDTNIAPQLRLSETLLILGQLDEAEEGFHWVRKRDPKNGRTALGLGRIALQRRQWPQARALLEAAATDRSSAKEATYTLAELHKQTGHRDLADQLCQRVGRLPADERWHDSFVEELHRLHVGKRIRLMQANRLFEQRRAREALAQFHELVREYPEAPEVWFALGQALHWTGAYPAAEQAMGRAVELMPGYAEAHNYLGAARLRQGKLAEAEPALRKAIDLKPDFAIAYVNLGRCLQKRKDCSAAITAYRDAIRCKPDFAVAYVELAELLHQNKCHAEALDRVGQALQINPADERAKQLRTMLVAKEKGR